MGKLIDMARSKKEREKPQNGCPPKLEEPAYPWGLRITLNHEELKKLGMSKLPDVGSQMNVAAAATVVAARHNETREGTERSLELELRRLSVSSGPASAEDAVSAAVDEADDD